MSLLKKPENVSFVNFPEGTSVPQEYMELIKGERQELKSFIYSLYRKGEVLYQNPISQAGIPGNIFYENVTQLDIYSQGETIALEALLYVDQQPITPDDWMIKAVLKSTPHIVCPIWEGTLGAGLYYKPEFTRYQIWIGSESTSCWFEGNYTIEVVAQEKTIESTNPKDRRIVLATYDFGIKYTNSSPHPESEQNNPDRLERHNLPNSSPNTYSTIKF